MLISTGINSRLDGRHPRPRSRLRIGWSLTVGSPPLSRLASPPDAPVLLDMRPLRESLAFRRLLVGSLLFLIGGQITEFAVALQVVQLIRRLTATYGVPASRRHRARSARRRPAAGRCDRRRLSSRRVHPNVR